jgi:DNA (cytosine-5)-methyltransferase 1
MSDPIKLIVIDSFCGAGGVTEGFHRAKLNGEHCVEVIIGINHDKKAIESHKANHPNTHHFIEDFRELDPQKLLIIVDEAKEKHPDAKLMFWMSAECTHHSKAKGGESRDADSRSLPEYAYKYIEILNPDIIGVENVVEFLDWGPLMIKTVKDKKGNELYSPLEIKKDKKTKKIIFIGPKYVPIPERKKEYYNVWVDKIKSYGYQYRYDKLNAADYGAFTSRTRYFGIFAKEPGFIVFPEKTHSKDGKGGKKKWNAVKEVLDFSDEGKSIFTRKKPLSDKTLERIYAGLIKFVAGGKDKWLLKYYSGHPESKNISVDAPAHTVTPIDHHALINTSFIQQRNSGDPKHKIVSVERPARTITATGGNQELVQAKFIGRYNGHPNQEVNAVSVETPAPTLTVKDRLSLISTRFIVNEYSSGGQHSSIDGVCPSILTHPKQKVIQCRFIDQQYGCSKPVSINNPLGSITTNPKYALYNCKWLMNTNFNNVGYTLNFPSPVITANRKHHYLVNPQFNSAGSGINAPCFTIIARMDKKPPYLISTETGQIAIEVYETDSEPMRKIKEFMVLYGIIDIKMRMLLIIELLRIMGFGDDYILNGTATDKKKFIGNAVECTQSQVIAEAIAMAIQNYLLTDKII